MYKYTAFSFFAFFIFCGCISAQEKETSDGLKRIAQELSQKSSKLKQKTIAVMPFETLNSPSGLGNEIPEKLTHELVDVGKFSVIERSKINKILKEQSLSSTGVIDADTASKIGKLLSVEALVVGTISNNGNYITARIVLTESGVIIASSQYENTKGDSSSKKSSEKYSDKKSSSKKSDSAYPTSDEKTFTMGEEDEPEGKIIDLKHFRSSNSLYFIGLVKNTGKVLIGEPHFDIILKDAKGEQFDVISCHGQRLIYPGEDVPFTCFISDYKPFHSYEVVYEARLPFYVSHTIELQTSNVRFKRQNMGLTTYVITGTIENTSDIPVTYPSVIAKFYDANNKFIGSQEGFATLKKLQPGQKSPFEINA
ncbi:MAG: FlgO family outer membrane protein, partial [Spirochaetia bacterium]|nr:FlgO family outer membrane protein [Spirochaetia bacterium]